MQSRLTTIGKKTRELMQAGWQKVIDSGARPLVIILVLETIFLCGYRMGANNALEAQTRNETTLASPGVEQEPPF